MDKLTVEEQEAYRAFMKQCLEKFKRDEMLDKINNPLAYINNNCKCKTSVLLWKAEHNE